MEAACTVYTGGHCVAGRGSRWLLPLSAEHLFLLSGCSVGLITPSASIRVLLPEIVPVFSQ